jgi:hypothetical protein
MGEQMFACGPDGAPRPVFAARDETGAHRVVEDVLACVLVMLLVADDPGGEPLAEERSLAPEPGVVLAGIVALDPLHGRREVFDPGVDECVVVRAHQAVDMEPEAPSPHALGEQRDEGPVVVSVAEQPGFVDGIRRQVEAAVRQLAAADSGHASTLRLVAPPIGRPAHFLSSFDTPSRAWASVRHSPWPEGPRRYSARRSTKR